MNLLLLSTGTILKDGAGKDYILDEMIGKGGFGYVFRAHRPEDDKVFAVKTMLPAFTEKTNIISFQNEIESAQGIAGNGVIKYEFAHTGDVYPEFPPYIIMEYADGGTLRSYLEVQKAKGEMLSNERILECFKELALGMQVVNASIIHRDIKPENILFSGTKLKITDFGLAKLAIESTRTFTFKGAGTPLYMAPEAWDYSKNTIQMDMYSMGLVFYEIATLSYAYGEIPQSYEKAKEMHMYKTIVRPSIINPALSPTIDSIICRMMEKRASKRFTNWEELIDTLDKQIVCEETYLDRIANTTIASKNTDFIKKTEAENEEKRKKKKQEDFIKNVISQFETEILHLLNQYVDKVNQNYAGHDKMLIRFGPNQRRGTNYYSCKIESGNGKSVEIELLIVLENSFQHDVYVNDFWSERRTVRRESYTPLYHNKKIWLMGEIRNPQNYGYNLLLTESDDLYGDWIIMKNHNNLSFMAPGKEKVEPFSFSLNELADEIDNVQCTHLYRTDFVAYDEEEFISLINMLITM